MFDTVRKRISVYERHKRQSSSNTPVSIYIRFESTVHFSTISTSDVRRSKDRCGGEFSNDLFISPNDLQQIGTQGKRKPSRSTPRFFRKKFSIHLYPGRICSIWYRELRALHLSNDTHSLNDDESGSLSTTDLGRCRTNEKSNDNEQTTTTACLVSRQRCMIFSFSCESTLNKQGSTFN